MNPRSQKKAWRIAAAIFCLAAFALGVRVYYIKRLKSRYAQFWTSTPRISWDALGESREAHIPFDLIRNQIVIHATSGGKPVDCVFDTGTLYPRWIRTLPLSISDTGMRGGDSSPGIDMPSRPTELMMVNELKLGPLDMRDIPGIAYAPGKEGVLSPNVLYLGNSVFAHTILTIDYRKQELIVQPAGTQVAMSFPIGLAKKDPKWNPWIPIAWNAAKPYGPGCPMIMGTINGHPAHLTIDTGNSAFPLAVTSRTICKTLRQANRGALRPSVYVDFEQSPPIIWALASVKYRTPAVLMPDFGDGKSDALVGERVLENYRITIDYSRSKLLLQWNPLQQLPRPNSHKLAN